MQGSRSRYVFRRHIAGESTIFGTEVAGESAVLGTEITGERCIFRSDIAAEGCVFGVKIALGLDRSGPGIQAGHGGIATGVYREFAVGPFNLAVGAHGCLGCVKSVAAGVDAVCIHHAAVGANLDSLFVQGNLVVLALVQDHFVGIGLGSGHFALGVNGSGVLLQNIVIAQAQSAIDGFYQFRICCHTGRSFCRNLIIQCRIGGFTSSCFRIEVTLQLIRRFVNRIGFVRNAFIQFVIGILTSLSFTSNRISIGLNLGIQCNDIFTYRIAGRYIIPAGKGIIHDALHADDFIFSGNICLGNDFVTVDGRLGSQGTFDQSIAIHVQVATAVQAARIDGTAYIGVVAYADRIGHTGRAGSEFIAYIDRSGADIARSVDAARGNGITFNGGRGRRSSIIISKGCPGRFSSSNLGIFSCSISRSINNLSI